MKKIDLIQKKPIEKDEWNENDFANEGIYYALKGNQTFSKLVEDNPSEMEIVFHEDNHASIFVGEDIFEVTFASSEHTDIYTVERLEGTNVGEVSGRGAITNFSKEVNINSNKVSDGKRSIDQLQETQLVPVTDSRKRQRPEAENTPKARSKPSSKSPKRSNQNSLIGNFVKVENYPIGTKGEDLVQFFSGLTIASLSIYFFADSSYSFDSVIYAEFETIEGMKLALQRSGEELSSVVDRKSIHTKISVSPVDIIEGYFAKQLGLSLLGPQPVSSLLSLIDIIEEKECFRQDVQEVSSFYYESYCQYESGETGRTKFIEQIETALKNDQGLTNAYIDHNYPWGSYSWKDNFRISKSVLHIRKELQRLWQGYHRLCVENSNNTVAELWIKRFSFFTVLEQLFKSLDVQDAISKEHLF